MTHPERRTATDPDTRKEPGRFGSAGWDSDDDTNQDDETVGSPDPDLPKPDPDQDQG